MQSLGVVARLFPDIVSGDKTATIRWRETPITQGYLRYVSDGPEAGTAVVWVARVTRMRLSETAAFVGRETEWPKDVMLAGMREHYPAIAWDDMVDVIEHLTPQQTRLRDDDPD